MSWRALVDRLTYEHRQHAYTQMGPEVLGQYEKDLNEALTAPSRVAAAHEFIRRQKLKTTRDVVQRAARMMGTTFAELNVMTDTQQITLASADTGIGVRGPDDTIPCEEGWCQHVVGLGRELAIEDATEHALVKGSEVAQSGLIVSYIGTPVLYAGHVVAVLCVYCTAKRTWSEDDAQKLRLLAESLTE